jgi:hypothetical protein
MDVLNWHFLKIDGYPNCKNNERSWVISEILSKYLMHKFIEL